MKNSTANFAWSSLQQRGARFELHTGYNTKLGKPRGKTTNISNTCGSAIWVTNHNSLKLTVFQKPC